MNVQISWRDKVVPMDTPIEPKDILKTQALRKAIAHLAIEVGGIKARSHAYRLVRIIKKIAAQAEKRGEYVDISTTNQVSAPRPWDTIDGLGLELRGISDNKIKWDINIFSSYEGCRTLIWQWNGGMISDPSYRQASNAAHLIRSVTRINNKVTERLEGTDRTLDTLRRIEEAVRNEY